MKKVMLRQAQHPERSRGINFRLVVSIIIVCGVVLLAGCGTGKQTGTEITSVQTGAGPIIIKPDDGGKLAEPPKFRYLDVRTRKPIEMRVKEKISVTPPTKTTGIKKNDKISALAFGPSKSTERLLEIYTPPPNTYQIYYVRDPSGSSYAGPGSGGTLYTAPIPVNTANFEMIYAWFRPTPVSIAMSSFMVGLPIPEFTGSLTSPTNVPPYTLTLNVSNFAGLPTGTEILYTYGSIVGIQDPLKPYCGSTTNSTITIGGINYTPAHVRLRFYDANQDPKYGKVASGEVAYTYTPPPPPTVPTPTITSASFVWGAGSSGYNRLTLNVTKPANGRLQYTYGSTSSIPDPISSYSLLTNYDSTTQQTIIIDVSYTTIYVKLRAQIPDPAGGPTPISSTVVGPYDYTCTPPQTADPTGSYPNGSQGPNILIGYYSTLVIQAESGAEIYVKGPVTTLTYSNLTWTASTPTYTTYTKLGTTSLSFVVDSGAEGYVYAMKPGHPRSAVYRYYYERKGGGNSIFDWSYYAP